MIRFIHICTLFVMAAVAVITPATAVAQEEKQTREVFSGEFEMVGEFTQEGRYFVSSSLDNGDGDYFKIMPGDNVRIDAVRAEIFLADWLMRISVNSSDAKHDNGDSKKVRATGDVRFRIGETTFEGQLQVQEVICQSGRELIGSGLFEGCYKYELKGKLRFVEVPADAAEI